MNIPLFKVYMPEDVHTVMSEVLHSGYVAEGEYVRSFEALLKNAVDNRYLVTTNSCTHAIHLALAMVDVKPEDYVLTTPMTCIATNVPIASIGAIPVWADVDPKHGMISPETLDVAIGAATILDDEYKAVVYVCWGGDIGPLPEVAEMCAKHGLPLIVDAAQVAVGTTYEYKGKRYTLGDGTHGDYVCFSFQAIKHVTTGDGGCMTVKDPAQWKRAFNKKWFGIDRDGFRTPSGEIDWTCDVEEIGFKFHMNNISGCIGREQLLDPEFDKRMATYVFNDVFMTNALSKVLERSWMGATASWVSTFLCDDVKRFGDFLRERGIHTSQMHSNLDTYSGFRGVGVGLRPGVTEFMRRHICLPCGWWVMSDERQHIVDAILEFNSQ